MRFCRFGLVNYKDVTQLFYGSTYAWSLFDDKYGYLWVGYPPSTQLFEI